MKTILIVLFSVLLLSANDKGFIYGKITLTNGKSYKGAIRWGKDYGKEHFWMDMFNSSKLENEYEEFVDRRDLRRRSKNFFGINFGNRGGLANHQFECFFGDIKKIIPMSSSRAKVVLKSNDIIEVKGADAGATLYILDEDSGDEIKIKWNRIEDVEFMETPEKLKYSYGEGLYGIVQTEVGKFEGLIQWDYDESLKSDKLDGDEEDFRFQEIKSIEKVNRSRVNVMLTNGREYRLSGSNDVDDDNRGIVVKVPGLGTVEIKWREFESVIFTEEKISGLGYNEFTAAKKMYALVEIDNNETIKGRIVYDLDETYDIETLDGEDDVDYSIPFKFISVIENSNRDAAKIELKSGKRLKLYDTRDVSRDNDGILIWTNDNEDPKYIRWSDIKRIKFE